MSRRTSATAEQRALRAQLSLLLAGAQQDWLERGAGDGADLARATDWAQRARTLQERIATADPDDVPQLTQQIDSLHAEIRRR